MRSDAAPRERREQLLVRKSRGLRDRSHAVAQHLPLAKRADKYRHGHLWTCPGCSHQNSPEFLSCRVCETLKWGVAP